LTADEKKFLWHSSTMFAELVQNNFISDRVI